MQIFREHRCQYPEVNQEIRRSELKMENLINKYRFFLITFLGIGDILVAHFTGLSDKSYLLYGIPTMLLVYFVIFKLHKLTQCEKPKPFLKYLTILLDYSFITYAIFELQHLMLKLMSIELNELLLISTMLYMVVNSLSALRIQKKVIAISTLLGILLNTLVHFHFGSSLLIVFYTDCFVLITGVFNQYISHFIYNFYATTFKLNATLSELSHANEEIITQNEEIHAQNDELEAQNEYLAKQRDEITLQKQQITSSIKYARRIQEAVLDTQDEISEVVAENFVVFKPKDIVSGDFYWFKNLHLGEKQYKLFTAVDCTGHGVPGGFMSMLGTSFLNEIVGEFKEELVSAQILNRLREEIKKHLHQTSNDSQVKDGMDMALCAIDYAEMKLQFSGANNSLYIIRKINGELSKEVEEYKADKMPIGVYIKEDRDFTNTIIDISKGDLLYVFSDGIIDQFGGKTNEKFKKRRFKNLLLENAHLPMNEQKFAVELAVKNWMGSFEQIDDITVIGVKV